VVFVVFVANRLLLMLLRFANLANERNRKLCLKLYVP
jgi:hypothetical protein